MAETRTDVPRVWVGCLGCYSAGALVGAWVDATEAEELEPHEQAAASMPATCGDVRADERWCMDHEGFGGLLEGECSPVEAAELGRTVERIREVGHPVEAVAAWVANVGREYANLEDLSDFEEAYCGEWHSGAEYAEELAEDIGAYDPNAAHGWPMSCIDWERAWRELEMGDGCWTAEAPGGLVYVFRAT